MRAAAENSLGACRPHTRGRARGYARGGGLRMRRGWAPPRAGRWTAVAGEVDVEVLKVPLALEVGTCACPALAHGSPILHPHSPRGLCPLLSPLFGSVPCHLPALRGDLPCPLLPVAWAADACVVQHLGKGGSAGSPILQLRKWSLRVLEGHMVAAQKGPSGIPVGPKPGVGELSSCLRLSWVPLFHMCVCVLL